MGVTVDVVVTYDIVATVNVGVSCQRYGKFGSCMSCGCTVGVGGATGVRGGTVQQKAYCTIRLGGTKKYCRFL